MRPIIILFFCSLLPLNQTNEQEERVQKGTQLFRSALIEHFIHPRQLDRQNWRYCEKMIRYLVEKKEEDFIEIRIERAFQRSEDTHVFRPIFIYANGEKYPMPAFRIMQ